MSVLEVLEFITSHLSVFSREESTEKTQFLELFDQPKFQKLRLLPPVEVTRGFDEMEGNASKPGVFSMTRLVEEKTQFLELFDYPKF